MIAETIGAIAARLRNVSGLMVYEIPPENLTSTMLPAAIVVHSGGEFSQQAVGYMRAALRFVLYLMVEFTAQGKMSERVQMAQTFYDQAINALMADGEFGGNVDHLANIRDTSGYSVVQYGGHELFCYQVEMEVIVKW